MKLSRRENAYTLFDGLTYTTRGYFADILIF